MDQKIKLSFTNVNYEVNEVEKYVECTMDVDWKADQHTLNTIHLFKDDFFHTVSYKARPKPGDEFNVEIGKSVARATAEKMAYQRMNRLLKRAAMRIMNVIVNFAEFADKADSVVEHSDRYLAKF